jgi:nicotinamide riboside kinase
MIISLSGYEGCGKTTLLNQLRNENNFKVVPETARLLIPLQDTVFKDSRDDLSYKSFVAYLNSLHFLLENNIQRVVFDRNMIDSLIFLQMYSDQEIPIQGFQAFIDKFNFDHNRRWIFDQIYLIKHSKSDEHIEKNIISDNIRYSSKTTVQEYKESAQEWEDRFMAIFSGINGYAKNLKFIQAFPDCLNPKSFMSL